jgi:hypothetical protein
MASSFSRSRADTPSLAVIDTPSAPPGWEDARAELIRIVDPLGRGVAWLAPSYQGRCVGYAVRPSGEKGTPWTHLFDASAPANRVEGCGPSCAVVQDDGAEQHIFPTWRFVERDPTFARLEAVSDRLTLSFSVTLDRGILELTFTVTNTSQGPIRLRLTLDAAPNTILASDTTNLAPNRVHTIVAAIRGPGTVTGT